MEGGLKAKKRKSELISKKSTHDFPVTVVTSCTAKLVLKNCMGKKGY